MHKHRNRRFFWNSEVIYTPEDAIGIRQSLSKNVDLAKNLVGKCQKGSHSISEPELGSIMEQLEEVIKLMGEELSLIPPSTFGDHEYAAITVRSVSKEMQNACVRVCKTQITRPKAVQPRAALSLEEQPALTERDLYSIDFFQRQFSATRYTTPYGRHS